MTDTPDYVPPKVWTWERENGGRFANINRPVAGATHEKELPRGKHLLQLYSLGTPNGVKVTIMLEELLAAGHRRRGVRRLAHQHPRGRPVRLPDSSASIPTRRFRRWWTTPCPRPRGFSSPARSSSTWRTSSAPSFRRTRRSAPSACRGCSGRWAQPPTLAAGFGHFYAYAPYKMEYPIDRFTMEVKRQLRCPRQAAGREPLRWPATSTPSPTWPSGRGTACSRLADSLYGAAEFLDSQSYKNVLRWRDEIAGRDAVKRGRIVNKTSGPLDQQLRERHDASDFELRTQDKLEAAE